MVKIFVIPIAYKSDKTLQHAILPCINGLSTIGVKKSIVEITYFFDPGIGITLQSGVSFPISPVPIIPRYFNNSFYGTLTRHPFSSV